MDFYLGLIKHYTTLLSKNILSVDYRNLPIPNSAIFPILVTTGFYYMFKIIKTVELKNKLLSLQIITLNEDIEKKRIDKFKKIEIDQIIEF